MERNAETPEGVSVKVVVLELEEPDPEFVRWVAERRAEGYPADESDYPAFVVSRRR